MKKTVLLADSVKHSRNKGLLGWKNQMWIISSSAMKLFFPGVYLTVRKVKEYSDQLRTFCVKSHNT